jgi:hypothetical protein
MHFVCSVSGMSWKMAGGPKGLEKAGHCIATGAMALSAGQDWRYAGNWAASIEEW